LYTGEANDLVPIYRYERGELLVCPGVVEHKACEDPLVQRPAAHVRA
jgi:hypothetical protein